MDMDLETKEPEVQNDECPPGEEPSAEKLLRKKAAETKEPPPPGVDEEELKKQRDEDSLDELTELKKNTSIGAILSGLSTGSYGSKAKNNVVKVEESGPRRRFYNNWGQNSGFGDDGQYGGGWGGGWGGGRGRGRGRGRGGGGGYGDMNTNWNSWNNNEDNYGGYEQEEEPMEEEDDSQANEAWIADETKLLETEFGPGIISIMYSDDGGLMYICDICQSQLNGRKSLDVHVNGMKHLKKKNIWEKKRRLEGFAGSSEDKKDENEQKDQENKTNTNNSSGGGNANLGGFPNIYTQPPPTMPGTFNFPPPTMLPPTMMPPTMVPPTMVPPTMVPPTAVPQTAVTQNQWNTPPPPPPVAKTENKPKTNLSGGATGTLLQKLAACAVKNLKDSDLATNVIIALVKIMKEYNHTRGDTRSIETLTEIDVRLRGLKAMIPVTPEAEKTAAKSTTKTSSSDASKENTVKSTSVTPDLSKTTGSSYFSSTGGSETSTFQSSGTGSAGYPTNESGTWYSQGKGYTQQSTDTKKAPPSTVDYSTPPPKTGYASSTDYSNYNVTQNPPPTKDAGGYQQAKPAAGYYSQPPYGQPPAAVMNIISAAPPPPPPVDNSGYNYGTQQYPGGYGGYYNTAAPASQTDNNYTNNY